MSGARSTRTLFITGATGFLGSALTVELLRLHRDERAICVVRGADEATAQARLSASLRAAAWAYGHDDAIAADVIGRVRAVPGDVTETQFGLDAAILAELRDTPHLHMWHCAASLKDAEPDLAELIHHNVEGAERAASLAIAINASVYNHVSTAYVAGRTRGAACGDDTRPRGFSNRYEQTKFYGEERARDFCARAGLPYRILRPSILVGHSTTGRSHGATGFLGWVLKVAALNAISGGALAQRSLRLVCRPDVHINLVPFDAVVEDCLAIEAAGTRTLGGTFLLTNREPPTTRALGEATARSFGLQPLSLEPADADFDPLAKRFHRMTRFERPYLQSGPDFVRDGGDALYDSPRAGRCPLPPELMDHMIREAALFFEKSLPGARREAA